MDAVYYKPLKSEEGSLWYWSLSGGWGQSLIVLPMKGTSCAHLPK